MADDEPALCFTSCDIARRIASDVGRTPELCEDGSDFRIAFGACSDCVAANDDSNQDLAEYVNRELERHLEYCDIPFASQTLTFINSSTTRTDIILVEATSTSSTTIPSSTTTTAPSSTESVEPGSGAERLKSSKAWIAGPVVGSVVGLALLLSLAFLLGRRRRKKKEETEEGDEAVTEGPVYSEPADESHGKAQLHADDMPKPITPIAELHPDTIYEIEGSSPNDLLVEKPANETPARELPGAEVIQKDEREKGEKGEKEEKWEDEEKKEEEGKTRVRHDGHDF